MKQIELYNLEGCRYGVKALGEQSTTSGFRVTNISDGRCGACMGAHLSTLTYLSCFNVGEQYNLVKQSNMIGVCYSTTDAYLRVS